MLAIFTQIFMVLPDHIEYYPGTTLGHAPDSKTMYAHQQYEQSLVSNVLHQLQY
jgi:hypothetical protein